MRFIDLGIVTPEYSVCADRAILESHSNGGGDTLCVYTRDRPTISLGRFQNADESVRDADDVSVIRRISGGSSIYSDEGQITYSVVIGKEHVPEGREESFEFICRGLMLALDDLGIDAQYKPINDVLVNNLKISGSAQFRDGGSILQHGSLIVRLNAAEVERHLIDRKKRSYDGLTSISEILGRTPDRKEIVAVLIKGFSEALDADIVPGSLTPEEEERINELMHSLNKDEYIW